MKIKLGLELGHGVGVWLAMHACTSVLYMFSVASSIIFFIAFHDVAFYALDNDLLLLLRGVYSCNVVLMLLECCRIVGACN